MSFSFNSIRPFELIYFSQQNLEATVAAQSDNAGDGGGNKRTSIFGMKMGRKESVSESNK
jgi:hypothetical protein